jgi:hypothetical protein
VYKLNKLQHLAWLPAVLNAASYVYTLPVDRIGAGQSAGNLNTYVTLDRNTNVVDDPATVRRGFRESTNQRYYALAWSVETDGAKAVETSFHPACQATSYRLGSGQVTKRFFVPFEIGYSRAGHFLLERSAPVAGVLRVRSRMLLPAGAVIEKTEFKGWKYPAIRLEGEGRAIVWGTTAAESIETRVLTASEYKGGAVELVTTYTWPAGVEFGLSFVYTPGTDPSWNGTLLNAAFDQYDPSAPNAGLHVFRLRHLLNESEHAFERYIGTARLISPDPVINRASAWAKVTQLRLQQQYRWGEAFTNNPPSDVVVGRDSMWYLMGSSYYAQAWSRKLLDFWFRYGIEPSGKFTEYMAASRDPMFSDDYGLNINDNTPLLIIAAHHYYNITGDRDFLWKAYPGLLRAANLIESQRYVGDKNHYGLVWCTSTEKFVRGLCGWRNAISNYSLSGAVTEINSEAYRAFQAISELAEETGDRANHARFRSLAGDLFQAINTHLRSDAMPDAPYLLNINPAGQSISQRTADIVYPMLYGIADQQTSARILDSLFTEKFWLTTAEGAGGFRSIATDEKEYQARADPGNYGLLGGVWPNLGIWIGRAAALQGRPDLSLKALRATALLTEMPDPGAYNVAPGEFPEYFNGDDLKQRGMPLSSFVPGIFIWSSLESFLGLTPTAGGIVVNPELPGNWHWVAASRIPYRGTALSLLAVADGRRLYSTAPVQTSWHNIVVPGELQDRFRIEPAAEVFGLVLPNDSGRMDVLVASSTDAEVRITDVRTRRELARFHAGSGSVVRKPLS